MNRQSGRFIFWTGFLAYAVSFLLPAVGGPGVYTPQQPSVADCALDWFFYPWIYLQLHSLENFFTDAPIRNVSTAISGLINPAFLLTVLSSTTKETPLLFRILI